LNEYKTEGFQLFERLLDSLREDVTQKLSQIRPMSQEEQSELIAQMRQQQQQAAAAAAATGAGGAAVAAGTAAKAGTPREGFVEDDPSTWGNPSRNDLCPCGSGKKFKHCHGRFA